MGNLAVNVLNSFKRFFVHQKEIDPWAVTNYKQYPIGTVKEYKGRKYRYCREKERDESS